MAAFELGPELFKVATYYTVGFRIIFQSIILVGWIGFSNTHYKFNKYTILYIFKNYYHRAVYSWHTQR